MPAAHTGSAAALAHPRFSHKYMMPPPYKAAVKEAEEMVVAKGAVSLKAVATVEAARWVATEGEAAAARRGRRRDGEGGGESGCSGGGGEYGWR